MKEKAGSLADRKSTRLYSSHPSISYAVFCLKKKREFIVHCRLKERSEKSEIRKQGYSGLKRNSQEPLAVAGRLTCKQPDKHERSRKSQPLQGFRRVENAHAFER